MMNCLGWFNSLIVNGNLDDLKNEFKAFAKNEGGYFNLIPPHFEIKDESVFYVDVEQDGNMTNYVRSFSFSQFVIKRIKEEFNKAVVCINDESKYLNGEEKVDNYNSLITQLNTFIYLNTKSDFVEGKEQLIVVLRHLVDLLIEKISLNAPSKTDENYLGETVFGFKGKVSEARLMYNTLEEIGLLNPDIDQYDIFQTILINSTSTMLVNLQNPLQVHCSNYKAAYIFRKMEDLFTRLSFRTIGNSKAILNKKGKPFTEQDLSKALFHFKKNAEIDSHDINEIDKTFLLLSNVKR